MKKQTKKKTLPSIFLEGNKQTPIRNSKVPTRKTTTMITVKASKPPIVNGCGVGGSGGGLGQELSQSAHEQAGVLSCIIWEFQMKKGACATLMPTQRRMAIVRHSNLSASH
uniref:Uncharacterized protein n=1 Tax=Glossina pallidipes TaxID=7398 RepID=A0A1B0AH85_GLOPL